MTGQHDDVVGQGQDLVAQAPEHGRVVAAGQVGATDRPREQQVAGEHHLRHVVALVRRPERHRSLGVPRGVVDDEPQPGQLQLLGVGQLLDVVGLGPLVAAAEQHLGRLPGHAGHRVGQQVPVGGVDPGGGVVGAGHRGDAPHVVDVAVGHQHGDRLQPVVADELRDAVGRVLAGVDDDALAAGVDGRDIAVGTPRTRGKSGDEHPRTLSRGKPRPCSGVGPVT